MRTYTIGEVLNRLKDEFDDITISKIRYLESEDLINPDRTEAGYRKFTDGDIERLRYVLRSQRDRYLPLKVIKDELARIDAGQPVLVEADRIAAAAAGDADGLPLAPVAATAAGHVPAQPAPAGPAAGAAPTPAVADIVSVVRDGGTDVRLSLNELCDASGLESPQIQALRDIGMISGDGTFDGDDLQAARAAAGLMRLGLETRHLRMYRQFADRQSALYEQIVTPLLRQRNPDARASATEQLDELEKHGARLQRTLLARELRGLLRS